MLIKSLRHRIKIQHIFLLLIFLLCILIGLHLVLLRYRWGIKGEYYKNSQWEGQATIVKTDKMPYLKGESGLHLLSTNTYSVRWTGWIVIENEGVYQFATNSDDGSFLEIGERRIVDNGGAHGKTRSSGEIYLKKGSYPITILYFQIGGYSILETLWTPPGKTEERISPDILFSKKPTNIEIFLRKNIKYFQLLIVRIIVVVSLIFLFIKTVFPIYESLKKCGIKRYNKEIILSFGSVFTFIVFTELLLRMINFSYYPTDIGFNITSEYKIFDVIGDYYKTKPNKTGVFVPQEFPCQKDKNEIRVFLVGGSSVHHLGTADYLKEKIQHEIKGYDKTVRIINISAGGYGTTRLLLHFQEILDYDPDIIILYSGHNEFEEKYLRDTLFKENFLSDISNKLEDVSKLYQLLSLVTNKTTRMLLSKNVDLIEKRRHPFFSADFRVNWDMTFDKNEVYKNYRQNIIEMIKLAENNKIDMMISKVAYNRRQPPFKALNDSIYASCEELLNQKKYATALECFDNALDADLQPHRATKTSNMIVSEIAKNYRVPVADVDTRIIQKSQNFVPGFDLFYDHCHLGENGNVILQDVLFETIVDNNLLNKFVTQ